MGLLLPAAVEDSPSLIEAGLADMVAAGDEGEPDVTVSDLLYQLQSRRSRPKSARFHQKVNLDRYFSSHLRLWRPDRAESVVGEICDRTPDVTVQFPLDDKRPEWANCDQAHLQSVR